MHGPQMLLDASLKFYEGYNGMVRPSPQMFLFKINSRHMIYLLNGILDAPNNYYQLIEHVAFIWLNEICRAILDRYTDPIEHKKFFDFAKTIAVETFKVNPKIFFTDYHSNQFFYG